MRDVVLLGAEHRLGFVPDLDRDIPRRQRRQGAAGESQGEDGGAKL